MKSCKKGFTIVEIVIALAIIAIVSLAATSLVLSSQSIQKKSRDKFFAVNLCNNSIAIFQSAASDSASLKATYQSFAEKISLLDITLDDPEDAQPEILQTVYFNGNWQQQSEDIENAKYECVISFTQSAEDTVNFAIQVTNKGNELYSSSYFMTLGGQP